MPGINLAEAHATCLTCGMGFTARVWFANGNPLTVQHHEWGHRVGPQDPALGPGHVLQPSGGAYAMDSLGFDVTTESLIGTEA